MKLFKNKAADDLEKKLLQNIDDYANKINLREKVELSSQKAEKHVNFGLAAGLGVGGLAFLGGIAMIPLAPAIATTALIGSVTVAGAALLTGGALVVGGVSYAGIGTLFKKFQESKLGDGFSRTFESHRMKMVDLEADRKINTTMYNASKGMVGPEGFEVYDIKKALQDNNVDAARQIVKDMVNRVYPDNTLEAKKLFKAPIADNLSKKLNEFYEKYENDATSIGVQNKVRKLDNKIFTGMAIGALGGIGAVAAIPLAGTALAVGLAVSAGYAAITYSGISALIKRNVMKKSDNELSNTGDKLIDKFSKEFNIDKSILESVKHKDKKEFVEEAKNRMQANLKI